MTLTRTHLDRLADASGDRDAYIAAQGALVVDGHAYWVEGHLLWGLSAHRGPGHETCQAAGPWTVAMWNEIHSYRSLLAEVEPLLRSYGAPGTGRLCMPWKDGDKLVAVADRLASVRVGSVRQVERERDDALAEVARLRGELAKVARSATAALSEPTAEVPQP